VPPQSEAQKEKPSLAQVCLNFAEGLGPVDIEKQ